MTFDAETLYKLLPAIYRIRDLQQGKPLKALIQVLAREVSVLEADLDQLYDDQFIETCAEWVVPYIGDLVGDRPLYTNLPGFPSARAAVANTIGYRRRKGTPAMLEQLARDVTGWPARVVEFFELLSTTQYMNHLRPHNLVTIDLRRWPTLEYIGSPFETTTRTAEMRRIPPRRGRYNIPNIGLFLWRLTPYTIGNFSDSDNESLNFLGTARSVVDPADGRYTFHPVRLDSPLFNQPLPEIPFTLAEPINVPEQLRPRVLYEELEAWRQDNNSELVYFEQKKDFSTGEIIQNRVFDIFEGISDTPIALDRIQICNLENWQRPSNEGIDVAVDPLLGRIAFRDGLVPEQVRVRYTYGFSADIGGGPYDRSNSVLPLLERPVTWQIGVSLNADPADPDLVNSLSDAISQWNGQSNGSFGVIAILDSHTHTGPFPPINIPEGSRLLIVAAGWGSASQQRQIGELAPEFLRPHLLGDLTVIGTAPNGSDSPGELILNGLLIEGALAVQSGVLSSLQINHCTVVPFTSSTPVPNSIIVESNNELLTLEIEHVITGPITIAETIEQCKIISSLIDGADGRAIEASATPAKIETSTILGTTSFRSLEASNSIFSETVTVERRQVGCIRFSSLPLKSQVPRRYRCQPNLALAELAKTLNVTAIEDPDQQSQIERMLSPHFTSRRYGDPAYGQLSQRCAVEIRQGADDESEMGVFHNLYQPQRETNLRVRLDEYLRFGLEAGILYVT